MSRTRSFAVVLCCWLLLIGGVLAPGSVRAQGPSLENGDVNGDGAIGIADAIYLLGFLFGGGPAPVQIDCDFVSPPADAVLLASIEAACVEALATYPEPGQFRMPIGSAPELPIVSLETSVDVLFVPDELGQPIDDLNVSVNLSHTFSGDLFIDLTSPSGTTVRLHDGSGGALPFPPTTYDDDAFPGTVLPDGPGTLSDFDGEFSGGPWSLMINDGFPGDDGVLHEWALRLPMPPEHEEFFEHGRDLLLQGSDTTGWTEHQLEDFARQVDWAESGMNTGIGVFAAAGGGSCTKQCKDEREQCIDDDCGTDTSWPCLCCAPCNITWMACLAACVNN